VVVVVVVVVVTRVFGSQWRDKDRRRAQLFPASRNRFRRHQISHEILAMCPVSESVASCVAFPRSSRCSRTARMRAIVLMCLWAQVI
jgi:hypothetical protein